MTRIMWDTDVRSMDDAILKLAPLLGLAARAAVPAAKKLAPIAAKKIGQEAAPKLLDAAAGKITGLLDQKRQQEQQLAETDQQIETTNQEQPQQQEQQTPPPSTQAMPPQAKTGSEITGMKGGELTPNPTEQPGTEATASTAPPPITKSFFKNEFGITGSDLIDLLQKAGEHTIVPAVVKMLRAEQHSIVKQFDWWDEKDWDLLELHDNDFNLISKYPGRLEYQLKKTLIGVKRAESGENRDLIWKAWHDRLNAENRLSRRERNLLTEAHNTLRKHGDMNAATITTYGLEASASEMGSIIKTHGWLYDIESVGEGTKNDSKAQYYGTSSPPVFLKRVDSFIGNLWEVGGEISFTKSGTPRLILPFTTKRAADYTNVLKSELGVEGIMWEGRQFVFEGDLAVFKAAEVALPFLNEHRSEACVVLAALEGDENAGRLIAFEKANPQQQVNMMKTWNISKSVMDEWKEVIVNGR